MQNESQGTDTSAFEGDWKPATLAELAALPGVESRHIDIDDYLEWRTATADVRRPVVALRVSGGMVDYNGHLYLPGARTFCGDEQNIRFINRTGALRARDDEGYSWEPSTRVAEKPGHAFVLGGMSNHWHFLVNFLPRLTLAREVCPQWLDECDSILVHGDATTYQQTLLERLGFSDSLEHLPAGRGELHQYESLTFISLQRNLWYSRRVLSGLRELLWTLTAPAEGAVVRKVYLRREFPTPRRSVHNDKQVSAFLRKEGFVEVLPERLGFDEQVRLFHDVDVLVAPHGAGLANMLACRPGTEVIVFEYKKISEMIALANQLDLSAIKINCMQHIDEEFESNNPDFESRLRDLVVPMEKFKSAVIAALRRKKIRRKFSWTGLFRSSPARLPD